MADDDYSTTTTWPKRLSHLTMAAFSCGEQLVGNVAVTVSFGHCCICSPRMAVREDEKVSYDRPGSRTGGIWNSSSPSVVPENNDKIDKKGDHETVHHIDARELHGSTGLLTKR